MVITREELHVITREALIRHSPSKIMAFAFRVAVSALIVVWLGNCDAVEGCPSGWTRFKDSCYHFGHDTEPWMVAQMVCRDLGGHLVEIETAAEENFLSTETVRRGVFPTRPGVPNNQRIMAAMKIVRKSDRRTGNGMMINVIDLSTIFVREAMRWRSLNK
ncbi:uncharacterized protein LOC127870502 isoform X2 [Dreissena polymorpha]|uniref:uncharacterized protein LOC127870502 isoform X2 n=1 Tax=Dreissena polymorpha TaxID=45954 RepID=UPI002264D3CA|nr:uncharacterized protein LOC127870502 isoform X2 [Dreissena polymorpha]